MRTETKWAVIATVILFIWLFVGKLLGMQVPDKMPTWTIIDMVVSILIFIVIYYMVTREKREHDLGGVMSLKQGFLAAGMMTLIFIPLSTLVVYIFAKAINPGFPSILMEFVEQGSIERDPVDYFLASHVKIAFFAGLLFSLIFAFINKRAATS